MSTVERDEFSGDPLSGGFSPLAPSQADEDASESVAAASDGDGQPGSLLDHLRRRREEIAAEATPELVLEVPGYSHGLGVRYRYPEAGATPIIRAFQRAQESDKPMEVLNANIDVVVACCHEIVGRLPGQQDWQPIDPDPDRPVKFNKRCADLLGIPLPEDHPGGRPRSPARHIARHVFSPRAAVTGEYNGDVALLNQGGELIAWLNTGHADGDEQLAGE